MTTWDSDRCCCLRLDRAYSERVLVVERGLFASLAVPAPGPGASDAWLTRRAQIASRSRTPTAIPTLAIRPITATPNRKALKAGASQPQ